MKHRSFGIPLAFVALAVVGIAAATLEVIATDLFNPRGIALGPADRVFVAETGSGAITQIRTKKGTSSTIAQLPADPEIESGPVDVAVNGLGNTYAVMSGPIAQLVRIRPNGNTEIVADIGAYQVTDPDPIDQDDFPEESNPNGIAILSGDRFLVADAANNDLLLINKQGAIETVARFPIRVIPFGAGEMPAEPVPTAVAIGPDGAWYVSELMGFPFTPGTSRIWRIEPGTTDATCDAAATTAPCRVYADGFTAIIDLAFGPDGTMYVLEIFANGLLSGSPVGALIAVNNGVRTELVPGQLLAPGGVAVDSDGTIYVTTGTVFGPGAGSVVRITP